LNIPLYPNREGTLAAAELRSGETILIFEAKHISLAGHDCRIAATNERADDGT